MNDKLTQIAKPLRAAEAWPDSASYDKNIRNALWAILEYLRALDSASVSPPPSVGPASSRVSGYDLVNHAFIAPTEQGEIVWRFRDYDVGIEERVYGGDGAGGSVNVPYSILDDIAMTRRERENVLASLSREKS